MSYATTNDVEIELGRLAASDAESDQWQVWIDRVERRIRRRFAKAGYDLDTQVDLDDPLETDLIDVEVSRVVDKINNPRGETSVTRSIDDASVTTRREGVDLGDPLRLSDDDWAALLPKPPKVARAYSVTPC